jgi:hypothetical protein
MSRKLVKVESETGKILNVLGVPDVYTPYIEPAWFYVEVPQDFPDFPYESHYFDLELGEFALMPAKTAPHLQFNYSTKQWEDTRSIAKAREDQWEKVKKQRNAAEFSTFTWDDSTFDADDVSQRRIQGASQLAMLAQGAGQPFQIDWTLANNTVRTLSGEEMIALGIALGQHVATQHGIARTLRAAIDAAQTIEAIEQIGF